VPAPLEWDTHPASLGELLSSAYTSVDFTEQHSDYAWGGLCTALILHLSPFDMTLNLERIPVVRV
jgi:hypothetical protein